MKPNLLLARCAMACALLFSAPFMHGSTLISSSGTTLSLSGSTALLQSGQAPNNTFATFGQSTQGVSLLSGSSPVVYPEGLFHIGISTALGSDLSPISIPATAYYSPYILTMNQIAFGDPSVLYNGGFRAPSSGWYHISGRAVFDKLATSGSGMLGLRLSVNGVTYTTSLVWLPMVPGGIGFHMSGERILYLNANDVVKLAVSNHNPPSGYIAKLIPNSEYGRDWHTTLSGYRIPDPCTGGGGGGGIFDGGTASNLTIHNLHGTGPTYLEELTIQAPPALSNTAVTASVQGGSETNSYNWSAGSASQHGFFGVTGSQVSTSDPVGSSETYLVSLTDQGLILAAGGSNGRISFRAGGYSPAEERMVITPEGKLGIGTSTPQQALDVQGGARIDGGATVTGSMNVSNGITISGSTQMQGDANITGNVTVTGSLRVSAGIRVEPQGDLLMGEYTADPNAEP